MNPVFAEYGLKDLLPLKLDIPDEGCTRPNRSMYCFEAGMNFIHYYHYYRRSRMFMTDKLSKYPQLLYKVNV